MIFEPREDGIVTAFDITGVAEEEGGPGEVTKIVTLQAPVKLASGQVVRKTLVLTMERRTGSWLVTGIAATAR